MTPLGRGSYGDLRGDGFRITRWDEGEELPGRHWFDPHALVLCLNVAGSGRFQAGETSCTVEPGSMVLAAAAKQKQHLERRAGGRHRFIVVEMRKPWVSRWLPNGVSQLREPARLFLESRGTVTGICETREMSAQLTQVAVDMLQPPKAPAAWDCWHHAKALEVVSHAMFIQDETELFCERTKRVARERVERVREILSADLEHPPELAELGRRVGCSPFYLSRIFRQETGVTISAFLRKARMERAAELIRNGEANVTEAAMTVGYSSLSHFSKVFAETFGCCPCLYGRRN
jgi:AraC-type DNA-binding domain-containing proteins